MPANIKRLLVLTSGGDAPGMNAAIRAVTRTALHNNLEIFGCLMGFEGLIQEQLFPMSLSTVANIIQRGGTILKTSRYLPFFNKTTRDHARLILQKYQIDAIVVLGGDGSFRGAAYLAAEGGPKVIGIPCTIDNDIVGTDYTIGFDTARNTALDAIDKIRDTASSHSSNFMVEVMGRASGTLAVDVGIAGGAEFILIPEHPVTAEMLAKRLLQPRRDKLASIIVVAEADEPGRTMQLAANIKQLTGIEYRICILGHIQRGGTPTLEDRKIASLMGAIAVESLLKNISNKMLAMNKGSMLVMPFPAPDQTARHFEDAELLRINDMICDS